MKRFTILATVIALVGCSQYSEELDKIAAPTQKQTEFHASMPECDTRTYVEDNKYLRWNAGDEITVFNGNSYNSHWKFAGENGANSGKFTEIEDSGFVTGTPLNLTANYAIYPYDENITITESGVVSLPLPATQAYNHTYANSFGAGANTMMAVTENASDNFLSFKNLCGYLKLKFYGDDVTVKSVTIKGNNGEKIAGKATVTMTYGGEPTITMGNGATDTITVDCGEGVELSSDPSNPTIFWVVIPETTFEGGITITVTDTNDQTFTKTTTNAVPIVNNMIQPMAALEVECEAQIVIPNNEIWYKSVDGNIRVPYYTTGFGAKYTTNEYNVESGYWIISFDGDVTTIPAYAFCNHNGSFGITEILLPQSLTTIESNAFYCCLELQDVYIPNNVNTIKDYAFNRCSGIQAFYGKYASSDNRCIIKDGVIISFATSGIDKYTTPSDANAIGRYAFYGATISSLTVTNNITTIGNEAFSNSLLESVVLPNSITAIPYGAFGNCYNLVSCNMPSAITTIGSNAFKHCSSLKTFTLPSTITTIGTNAFKNTQIETLYILCDIPDDNSGSGINAYFYSANIGHAIIGEQVTSIGKSAFAYSNIQKLTLGENISSIGRYALNDCKLLTEVYCKSSTPPFAEYSFSNLTSINKIYVPASDDDSIITAYKSAIGWSNYAAYIEEYDFTE